MSFARAKFSAVWLQAISVLSGSALVILLAVKQSGANQNTEFPELELAAAFELPKLPEVSGPSPDWRQWDSFFTFVVKRFGQDLSGDLRDSLGEAFLDSRYELTSAVARSSGRNPVPELFLNGWKRLSPIMNKALPGLPKQTASQYANFISAADKLASFGQQGSQLGLVQFSPDALRGMARILEPRSAADPIAYTVNVDRGLRNLLGLGAPLAAPNPSSGIRKSGLPGFPLPLNVQEVSLPPSLFDGVAVAVGPNVSKLNRWVPEIQELQAYLSDSAEKP